MNRVIPLASILLVSMLLFVEPVIANKFVTISGGVSGSNAAKQQFVFYFFLAIGGVLTLGTLLAIFYPRRNAHELSYRNWKESAIIMAILAVLAFVAAFIFAP